MSARALPGDGGRLPALRQDLQLMLGSPTHSGEQAWLVYDPVCHRYHELDRRGFCILSVWGHAASVEDVAVRASDLAGEAIQAEDVSDVVAAAAQLNLFVESGGGWRTLLKQAQHQDKNILLWIIHNYLFVRIPLFRPQHFLDATLPVVRIVASRPLLWAYGLLGLITLYLVSRHWTEFTAAVADSITLSGAVGFLIAIAFVKTFHELGHAYVAAHYRCRVPTIGIAFMVLMPVLYTDVTDAWRLRSRRARLAIDFAGIAVELAVAIFALFFWTFLPEGALRSAAFFVGTGSLLSSLLINLNPFMRFDGYYILADSIRIPNLQPRSFALARWWLRETLFGLGDNPPEQFRFRMRNFLIFYAIATWIYRLILFLGIAVLVYITTFKILGIILFIIEILWFIAFPVFGELSSWWRERGRIMLGTRSYVSSAVLVAIVGVGIIPWSVTVEVPAILEPASYERLAVSEPGKVVAVDVSRGQSVRRGDILVRLESPRLDTDIRLVDTKIELIRLRLARRAADQADLSQSITLEEQLAALDEQRAGLLRRQRELEIRAPIAGVVREIAENLHAGRWLGRKEELALIVTPGNWQARGYVSEDALWRIDPHARAVFVPENLFLATTAAQVSDLGRSAVPAIENAYLATHFGGPIAVRESADRSFVPVVAQFPVRLASAASQEYADSIVRGTMRIESRPESIATSIFRKFTITILREAGF